MTPCSWIGGIQRSEVPQCFRFQVEAVQELYRFKLKTKVARYFRTSVNNYPSTRRQTQKDLNSSCILLMFSQSHHHPSDLLSARSSWGSTVHQYYLLLFIHYLQLGRHPVAGVVTCYISTDCEDFTVKFRYGGLHEKHAVATGNCRVPSQHLLKDPGKPRTRCVEIECSWEDSARLFIKDKVCSLNKFFQAKTLQNNNNSNNNNNKLYDSLQMLKPRRGLQIVIQNQ